MYKVCFADDEILDFQLLERLVDWNAMGFEIAGTATDGLECMKRIRERNQSVIIVIISAYEEFSYAKTAIQYGVTDYIIKPVGRAQLNETVKKIRLLLDEKKTVLARSRQKELELTYFELQKELTPVNCRQLSASSYHSFFASITDAFCIRSYLPDGTRPAYPLLQRTKRCCRDAAAFHRPHSRLHHGKKRGPSFPFLAEGTQGARVCMLQEVLFQPV